MIQSNFIQEVSFTGEVIESGTKPDYKVDTFVNVNLIERVKPTKHKDVLIITLSSTSAYVLREDLSKHMPEVSASQPQ
jgi:hypothetical protein